MNAMQVRVTACLRDRDDDKWLDDVAVELDDGETGIVVVDCCVVEFALV